MCRLLRGLFDFADNNTISIFGNSVCITLQATDIGDDGFDIDLEIFTVTLLICDTVEPCKER